MEGEGDFGGMGMEGGKGRGCVWGCGVLLGVEGLGEDKFG